MSKDDKKPAPETITRCTAMYFAHPGVQLLWEGHNGRELMLTEAQLAKVEIIRDGDVYVVMSPTQPGKHWEFPVERVEVMEFETVEVKK